MFEIDVHRWWAGVRPWIVAFVPDPDRVPSLLASGFDYAIKAGALLAFIMTLRKLPQIREVMTSFNDNRSAIWDLRKTVDDLKNMEPVIKSLGDRFERLADTVDVIRAQNVEAQLESSVERIDGSGASEAGAEPVQPSAEEVASQRTKDQNWLQLRRLYLRNARRLQGTVDAIADGRTRNRYERIGWKRPKQMVQTLAEDGYVSRPVADASVGLIEKFYAYRRQHAPVPDEVVAALNVLDGQLEQELGPAPDDEALY